MPKINQEEYEILKNLDDKWEWIARDEDRDLDVFEEEPYRDSYLPNPNRDRVAEVWLPIAHTEYKHIDSELFQFIQWENEPYNIQDLIWEYEFKELTEFILELEKETFEKLAESEETEVKNIEWLKEWFSNDEKHYSGEYILSKINQLEVEILSQEWIDEHIDDADVRGSRQAFIHVEDLQNLLVPKQEEVTEGEVKIIVGFDGGTETHTLKSADEAIETLTDYGTKYALTEKPVIPRFIADYLPLVKEDIKLEKASYYAVTNNELPKWEREYDWIRDNFETFVKAWLAYPNVEVEEEPRFFVYLGDGQYLVSDDELREPYAKIRHEEDSGFSNYVLTFTEQEIKNYDHRYFAFARPVEEVEE